MATLPSRGQRRGGNPRAPQPFTPGDIPSVNLQNDPGATVPPGATGGGIGEAIGSFGQTVGAVGAEAQARNKRLQDAADRIQKQRDIVESDRSIRDLNKGLSDEVRTFTDANDLSLEEDVQKLSQNIQGLVSDSKNQYRGSDFGRIGFEGKADALKDSFSDEVSVTSTKLRRKLITDQIQSDINTQIQAASDNPENLPAILDSILGNAETPGLIEERAQSLSNTEEIEFTAAARKDVTQAAVDTLLLQGTVESLASVETILNSREAQTALGPEGSQKARERMIKLEREFAKSGEDQTKAEENEDNFNRYITALKKNPDADPAIVASGFGIDAAKGSEVKQDLDNIKLINDDRAAKGRPPLTQAQEDAIIFDTKVVSEGQTLFTGAGTPLARVENAPDVENDNVKGSNLTVKAEAEVRRQLVNAVGLSVDAQGNVVGDAPQAQRDLLVTMGDQVTELVKQGRGIAEAVLMVKMAQPEGTFRQDQTFTQAAEDLESLHSGKQAPIQNFDNVSVNQGKQELDQITTDINSIDLENATGFTSGMVAAWNRVAGQFSSTLVDTEVTQARLKLGLAARGLIQLFALNPRFAVAEQEVLTGLMGGPELFDDPESARSRMGTLNKFVDNKIAVNKSLLTLGTGDDKTFHVKALNDLNTLFQMKSILRQFDTSPGGKTVQKFTSPEIVSKADRPEVEKSMRAMGRQGFKRFQKENPDTARAMLNKVNKTETKKPAKAPAKPTGLPPSFKRVKPKAAAKSTPSKFDSALNDAEAVAVMSDKDFSEFIVNTQADQRSDDVDIVVKRRLKERIAIDRRKKR